MKKLVFLFVFILSPKGFGSYWCERAKIEANHFIVKTWSMHMGLSCDDIISNIETVIQERVMTVQQMYSSASVYARCFSDSTLVYFNEYQKNLLSRCNHQVEEVLAIGIQNGYEDCKKQLESGQYTGVIEEYPPLPHTPVSQPFLAIRIENNEFWDLFLDSEHERGYFAGCAKAEYDFTQTIGE